MGDDCGYTAHAGRIERYTIEHTPESVIPYIQDAAFVDGFPDGCSVCNRATWWESRTLPNGARQVRCTECKSTLVFWFHPGRDDA